MIHIGCQKEDLLFYLGILYILLFLNNCNSQAEHSNSKARNFRLDTIPPNVLKTSESDSIPFRFLSYEEQEKLRPSEPYHNYGKVQLFRSGGYYAFRDGEREIITEIYPGILLYKRKSGEKGSTYWKIEFYEVQSKKLIREINLEQTTPYTKSKFSNIEFGLYGGQDAGHKSPPLPDSNCIYPRLHSPDNYLTTAYVNVSPGGHVCVRYELYKLWKNLFVGFENTCVFYNSKGDKKWGLTLPNNISAPYVTSDGKYLSYIYGSHTSDNFFDACQGHITILDLNTNEPIFHYVFGKDEMITTMFEAEKDGQLIIQSRNPIDHNHVNKIVILDFQALGFYERSFTKEEWKDITQKWVSYEHLKKQYLFNFKRL